MKICIMLLATTLAVVAQTVTQPSGVGITGLTSNGSTITSTLPVSMTAAVLGPYTVGTLPAASGRTNQIVMVTDGVSGQDCTTGGGSTSTLCRSNGTVWASLDSTGITGLTTGAIPYATSATAIGNSPLFREDANTVAQRNGVTAQALYVYGTYTDASNYARLGITYVAGFTRIYAQTAGTGGNNGLEFGTNGTARWNIVSNTGHLLATTDNTYDIGAAGATRPRSLIVAGTGTFGSDLVIGNGRYITGTTVGGIQFVSSGVIRLLDSTFADFNRLQLGGTTSLFVALSRVGTTLAIRLADNSADAPITALNATLSGKLYVAQQTPASATATCTINQFAYDTGFVYVCTATDTWKRATIATW